jgi:hypothetical protein
MSPHGPASGTLVRGARQTGSPAAVENRTEAADLREAAAATPRNGPAAAAILAAGIGACALGAFSLIGDAFHAAAGFFTFYLPTGPLSGVTTSAIVVWLVAWFVLSRGWAGKTVAMAKVNAAAFVLLALGILLTFPPFMDLLQGK